MIVEQKEIVTWAGFGEGLVALLGGAILLYILTKRGVVTVDKERFRSDRERIKTRLHHWAASPWSVKKGLVLTAAVLAGLFAVVNPPILLMLAVFGWLYYRPGRERSLDAAASPSSPQPAAAPRPPMAPAMAAAGPRPNPPFPVRPGFRRPFPARMWMRRQRPSLFRRMVRGVGVLMIIGLGVVSLAILCGDWPRQFTDNDSPRFARRLAEIFDDDERDAARPGRSWKQSFLAGKVPTIGDDIREKVDAQVQAAREKVRVETEAAVRPKAVVSPTRDLDALRKIRDAKQAREKSVGLPPAVLDVDRPEAELLSHSKVILRSNPWPSDADGVQEIVERVAAVLPHAVEMQDESAHLGGWTPSSRWVRTQLLTPPKSLPEEIKPDGTKLHRVEMELSLLPKNLEAVYKRFRADRSSERTFLLAKTYAGSVLIVGGLAIVARLGTGRRREPTA
jgi:hypothetical protein